MSGDLISLRILTVFSDGIARDLLRQGAGSSAVPIEVLEAGTANGACGVLTGGDIDIVLLDAAVSVPDRTAIVGAAHAAKTPAFVILVAASKNDAAQLSVEGAADGQVTKPTNPTEAQALIQRCLRVRLPSRVLVVDDSPTMRGIVRKILSGSQFHLEVSEAHEGIEALKQIQTGKFDLVVVDYNMPGLNGIETMAEIKRQFPRTQVVMMTATPNEEIAKLAREAGAAAFLKKPFYPADIDAVLRSVFGLTTPR